MSREAFDRWALANDISIGDIIALKAWKAACDYQREMDAELIERTDMKNLAEYDVIMAGFTANLLCGLTTVIRANKGE